MSAKTGLGPTSGADTDRRKFVAACGKFAIVTPPAMTLLLSTSLHSTAIAASTGNNKEKNGNNGFGNGGYDGSPNDKEDKNR